MFKLPTYQELSKEQDKVYQLPVSGSHLIIGPPGTGKTVIALYRAEMLHRQGLSTQFVVYNNTLNQFLEGVLKERKLDGITSTFHKWFPAWYEQNFAKAPPQLEQFKYDWFTIYQEMGKKVGGFTRFPNLIIDEAQDFPKELYMVMSLMVDNLTVFADENQRIGDSNCTIDELRKALGVKNVHCLSKNYRNSLPIAEFARCFYAGLQSGMPDLPTRAGVKPRMIFTKNQDEQFRFIINYANNNPSKNIGVFVPYKDMLGVMYSRVAGSVRGMVQMYLSGDKAHKTIRFHIDGLKLVTYASAKGLEFDTVIIPFLEKVHTNIKIFDISMSFYVLASRARDELILLTSGEDIPFMMKNVPPSLYQKAPLKRG